MPWIGWLILCVCDILRRAERRTFAWSLYEGLTWRGLQPFAMELWELQGYIWRGQHSMQCQCKHVNCIAHWSLASKRACFSMVDDKCWGFSMPYATPARLIDAFYPINCFGYSTAICSWHRIRFVKGLAGKSVKSADPVRTCELWKDQAFSLHAVAFERVTLRVNGPTLWRNCMLTYQARDFLSGR